MYEVDCSDNQLTSLEFGPKIVERGYDYAYNELTNLIGSPDKVDWKFNCYTNKLTTLEGIPSQLGNYLDCSDNELTKLSLLIDHLHASICSDLLKLGYAPEPINPSDYKIDNMLYYYFVDMYSKILPDNIEYIIKYVKQIERNEVLDKLL